MIRRTLEVLLACGAILTSVTVPVACVTDDPGPSIELSCEAYCTEVAKSCGGANEQYRNTDECMKTCKMLDLGTEKDGDVNTIGCRLRKAKSAKTLADCVAAGPFGGGVCGARCAAFCTIVGKNCLAVDKPPFEGSEATCNEACPTFTFNPAEGEGPGQRAFSDSLNCRTHHLILSLSDPKNHCPHTDVKSVVCQ
jgi:hypothetical protein